MGIYELMIVDEEIRRCVAQGQDAAAIMQVCVSKGMRTLRGDGMLKVLQGHTSLDEIFQSGIRDVAMAAFEYKALGCRWQENVWNHQCRQ